MRIRRLTVTIASAALLAVGASGCSLVGLAGGAAAGGNLQAQQLETAQETATNAAQQAAAASGQGSGRVPGSVGCPQDVDSLARVMGETVRRSALTATETLAFDVLLRSARVCDPTLAQLPQLGTYQAN